MTVHRELDQCRRKYHKLLKVYLNPNEYMLMLIVVNSTLKLRKRPVTVVLILLTDKVS
jgi:hypothetical protein